MVSVTVIGIITSIIVAILLYIANKLSDIEKDTEVIKETTMENIEDLLDLLTLVLRRGSGTFKYTFKHLGKVKISFSGVTRGRTVYKIDLLDKTLPPSGFISEKAEQNEKIREFEEDCGDEIRILSLEKKKLRILLPSEDEEKCRRFLVYFLKWLDDNYEKMEEELSQREEKIEMALEEAYEKEH